MGHELVICAGRSAVINDADLWLMRHFALEQLAGAANEVASTELRRYFEAWSWVGPGVYLNLDPPARDDEVWIHALRQLLALVRCRVRDFGPHLPADYARIHVRGGRCEWNATLSTAPILRATDAFEDVAVRRPVAVGRPADRGR